MTGAGKGSALGHGRLAFYGAQPEQGYWSALWAREALERLVAVARRDPLTAHLRRYLPREGLVLEGGCGLGQYVVLFGAEGYQVVGGDFSLAALVAHRREQPASPLVLLDLLRLPCADETLQAHISLGVAEHFVHGPQPLLRELCRTLAPGGVLLLGTVWINGWRRLTAPLVRRREARKQAAGALFYQYAFTSAYLRGLLEESGLKVLALHPYSPALGLRDLPLAGAPVRALRRLGPARRPSQLRPASSEVSRRSGVVAPPAEPGNAETERPRGLRRMLYWPPVLATFAHMVLVVARKPVR